MKKENYQSGCHRPLVYPRPDISWAVQVSIRLACGFSEEWNMAINPIYAWELFRDKTVWLFGINLLNGIND